MADIYTSGGNDDVAGPSSSSTGIPVGISRVGKISRQQVDVEDRSYRPGIPPIFDWRGQMHDMAKNGRVSVVVGSDDVMSDEEFTVTWDKLLKHAGFRSSRDEGAYGLLVGVALGSAMVSSSFAAPGRANIRIAHCDKPFNMRVDVINVIGDDEYRRFCRKLANFTYDQIKLFMSISPSDLSDAELEMRDRFMIKAAQKGLTRPELAFDCAEYVNRDRIGIAERAQILNAKAATLAVSEGAKPPVHQAIAALEIQNRSRGSPVNNHPGTGNGAGYEW